LKPGWITFMFFWLQMNWLITYEVSLVWYDEPSHRLSTTFCFLNLILCEWNNILFPKPNLFTLHLKGLILFILACFGSFPSYHHLWLLYLSACVCVYANLILFPFGFPDVLEGEIFLQNLPSIIAAHALGTYVTFSFPSFCVIYKDCFFVFLDSKYFCPISYYPSVKSPD
jgi:hypothetical protein